MHPLTRKHAHLAARQEYSTAGWGHRRPSDRVALSRLPLAILAALSAAALACYKTSPPAIDPQLASSVPAGTPILAGVDCQRLRAAPLYPQLSAAAKSFLEPFREARYLLFALQGTEPLMIAQGTFREPPAGATLLAPGLVAAGSPNGIRAASAQFRSGRTGAPELLERAEPLAAANEIWIVADGSATLPLTGNAENVNRLLHSTRYATLTAHISDGVRIDITGVCATADTARQLEETVRAFVTLAAAGSARQPELAAQLRSIQVTRDDRTVRASLATDATGADRLLHLF
jgi:hypothetical protein